MNRGTPKTSGRARIVFLFDVDNTLLDNDRIIADLTKYLLREVGPKRARCYWTIFERLRTRLGYADYLAPCSVTEVSIRTTWICWLFRVSS